jgi:signal transduction histidine kinase/CheY-like chemotaxis protein
MRVHARAGRLPGRLTPTEALLRRVRGSAGALVVPDLRAEAKAGRPALLAGAPRVRSLAAVPVRPDTPDDPAPGDPEPPAAAREAVARGAAARRAAPPGPGARPGGVLVVVDPRPGTLTPGARRALAALGRQAGALLALTGARAALARLAVERRRAETLAALAHVLTRSLDPEQVARWTADSLQGLLEARSAALYSLDDGTGDLVAWAVSGEAWRGFPGPVVLPRGMGLAGLAVRERAAVTTPDVLADARVTLPPAVRAHLAASPDRAMLAVPVVSRERVIGALGVSDAPGRRFTEEDLRLARALADHAAVALDNARLFAEATRHRREAEELARVARMLTETLDVEAVARGIVDSALPLFGARFSRLRLRQADGALRLLAWGGWEPGGAQDALPPGVGVAGRAAAEGKPVWTADALADPEIPLAAEARRRLAARDEGAILGVPLRVQGEVLGALTVGDRAGRRFTDHEVALLQLFADQAALALEHARLFAESGALLREAGLRQSRLESLLEVSRQLSRLQPLDSLLGRIAEACGRILDSDSVGLRVVEGEDLVLAGSWGVTREIASVPRLRIGESLSGLVAATREPLHVTDPAEDSRLLAEHRAGYRRLGLRAWLGVPITTGDRVAGVLSIQTRRRARFTEAEVGMATAFASQMATALENARLYGELRQAYDELSRTQAQLTQAQKMEAVGQLAGGVAHDFNNLLTVVRGRAELLLRRLEADDPLRRQVELIEETSGRAAALTQQLLAFSRKQLLRPRVLDLNPLLAGLEPILRRLLGESVALALRPAPGPVAVHADPSQLEQVVLNLAVNARDAMPEGGQVVIETAAVDLDEAFARRHQGARPGPAIRLAVADTGTGMDEATLARIFEPFFTTKEVGRGTGLGLATVYGIVKQSGGYIRVESAPGRGSRFEVYLPRVEAAAADAPPSPAGPGSVPGGTETVLLVEDEPGVRDLARDVLAAQGYRVLAAGDPAEALRLSGGHPGPVHLLLTDVVMPGMSGRDLAERLLAGRPGLRVLYMSGYADHAIVEHGVVDPAVPFLPKPFTAEALARRVRDALDAGAAPRP